MWRLEGDDGILGLERGGTELGFTAMEGLIVAQDGEMMKASAAPLIFPC
jgi:hypothetical protein